MVYKNQLTSSLSGKFRGLENWVPGLKQVKEQVTVAQSKSRGPKPQAKMGYRRPPMSQGNTLYNQMAHQQMNPQGGMMYTQGSQMMHPQNPIAMTSPHQQMMQQYQQMQNQMQQMQMQNPNPLMQNQMQQQMKYMQQQMQGMQSGQQMQQHQMQAQQMQQQMQQMMTSMQNMMAQAGMTTASMQGMGMGDMNSMQNVQGMNSMQSMNSMQNVGGFSSPVFSASPVGSPPETGRIQEGHVPDDHNSLRGSSEHS